MIFDKAFSEEDLRKCKEIAEKGFKEDENVRYPSKEEQDKCVLELENKLSSIRDEGGNRVNRNFAREVFIGYYYVLKNYSNKVTGTLLKDDLTNGKFNTLDDYTKKKKELGDLSEEELQQIVSQGILKERQRLIAKGIIKESDKEK